MLAFAGIEPCHGIHCKIRHSALAVNPKRGCTYGRRFGSAQLAAKSTAAGFLARAGLASINRIIRSLRLLRRRLQRISGGGKQRSGRSHPKNECDGLAGKLQGEQHGVVTSKNNAAFLELRRLVQRRAERQRAQRFVAEGETFLRMRPRAVFVRQSEWIEKGAEIQLALSKGGEEGDSTSSKASCKPWRAGSLSDSGEAGAAPGICILSDSLFDSATRGTSRKVAQGIVNVFALPTAEQAHTAELGNRVVVLDGVRDAANVGLILRTMDALGATALVSVGGSFDMYDRKVVRCSMGVPIRGHVRCSDISDVSSLRQMLSGYQVFAAMPSERDTLQSHIFEPSELKDRLRGKKAAFVFGSERRGVSEEVLELAEAGLIRIPMVPHAESLNVAVAASITLYCTCDADKPLPAIP